MHVTEAWLGFNLQTSSSEPNHFWEYLMNWRTWRFIKLQNCKSCFLYKFNTVCVCFFLHLYLFAVEWSKSETFVPMEGEITLDDVRNLEVEIKHLKKGTAYYVRVSAMNMKGFSSPASTCPTYAVPSSKYKFTSTFVWTSIILHWC